LKYLLDTNILSELRKSKPHGGVLAWSTAFEPQGFAIPALAVFELHSGVEQVRAKDARATDFDFWISRLERGSTVLPFDSAAAREAARLLSGKPGHLLVDGMIAAIARIHGLMVATRNTKDFIAFDVAQVNPFEYRG
jgi:predicted nucleic acid-binding protein